MLMYYVAGPMGPSLLMWVQMVLLLIFQSHRLDESSRPVYVRVVQDIVFNGQLYYLG